MNGITRRDFLQKLSAAGVGIAGARQALMAQTTAASRDDGEPLNVLFIMTDQQTYTALGVMDNRYVRTPNLDRLAREGALFENAYCTAPYCSPSRASIVTGLYPHSHGVIDNVDREGKCRSIYEGLFPLTEGILHDKGYATGHWGKWHLCNYNTREGGEPRQFHCNMAFDCYRKWPAGYPERQEQRRAEAHEVLQQIGLDNYYERTASDRAEMIAPIAQAVAAGKSFPIGKSPLPAEYTFEGVFTEDICDVMERNTDRPWMLTASYHPPHEPWVVPEPYYSMLKRGDIELPPNQEALPEIHRKRSGAFAWTDAIGPEGLREWMAVYYSMVTMIDDYVGKLLDKLDELGLAEQTLVVFTTDHGDMAGSHGVYSKNIRACYENIVHIPMIMRLPGKIKPGTRVQEMVSLVDLMPTILDYAGQKTPAHVQGQSLRPLIDGKEQSGRDYVYVERSWPQRYDLIQRMVRGKRWKYVWSNTLWPNELFDMQDDPWETRNLFNEPKCRDIVMQYHQQLISWMKETDDPSVILVDQDPFAEDALKIVG